MENAGNQSSAAGWDAAEIQERRVYSGVPYDPRSAVEPYQSGDDYAQAYAASVVYRSRNHTARGK